MYRILGVLLLCATTLVAQRDFYQTDAYQFDRGDTLRGMLRPERTAFDVHFYALDVAIDPAQRTLTGSVEVAFTLTAPTEVIQLDLYENMTIDRIEADGQPLDFRREYNAVFVDLPAALRTNDRGAVTVHYHGTPRVAPMAPWDGGFAYSTDSNGKPWIGVACEGDGASLWWPNKDHLSDEPDSMSIKIAVPRELMAVSNGDLRGTTDLDNGYRRYDWFVQNSIDNYNVTVNIGDYVHFGDLHVSPEDGDTLRLDYYVLRENEATARTHFQQVKPMLDCFERAFGKYPFYEDGFALVETPYLGMEHQSAIAYGNKYMRGYLGGMIPAHHDWDYIIVHEAGHEWFGNSLSVGDMSEMWIQESFTTYSEAVFVECQYGYEEAVAYLESQRRNVRNREPVRGPMQVNFDDWSSSDHYYKGAWIIHTFRHALHDDVLFRDLLKNFHEEHKRSIVTTEDWIDYVNRRTGQDWSAFWEQYLWYPDVPKVRYRVRQDGRDAVLSLRLFADVPLGLNLAFDTPDGLRYVEASTEGAQTLRLPNTDAATVMFAERLFLVDGTRLD